MSKQITPTVGRKVWFYWDNHQTEPHDATIIKVWDSPESAHPTSPVNLDVVDPFTGEHRLASSLGVGDEHTPYGHYRWMPYQKDQHEKSAAATEAATA